ncbi:unnamed protein product, partial [Discosporangium mesarthrocarpum]
GGGWHGGRESPYQEGERMALVFRCLVEACGQCLAVLLGSGEGQEGVICGRGGAAGGQALAGVLRRCLLPMARCCIQALRSLEWQLDHSLEWRCNVKPLSSDTGSGLGLGSGPGGRGRGEGEGEASVVDFGQACLIRPLLEEIAGAAAAVQWLCGEVKACAGTLKKTATANPPGRSSSRQSRAPPHGSLQKIIKIIPGLVLQSDMLTAAVDAACQSLRLQPIDPALPPGSSAPGHKPKDNENPLGLPNPGDSSKKGREKTRARGGTGAGAQSGAGSGGGRATGKRRQFDPVASLARLRSFYETPSGDSKSRGRAQVVLIMGEELVIEGDHEGGDEVTPGMTRAIPKRTRDNGVGVPWRGSIPSDANASARGGRRDKGRPGSPMHGGVPSERDNSEDEDGGVDDSDASRKGWENREGSSSEDDDDD